jgi:hypothetical protein
MKPRELVQRLGELGLKFSAVRMLDGSLNLYKFRTMNFYENEEQITALWKAHIGDDPSRIHELAEAIDREKNDGREPRDHVTQ